MGLTLKSSIETYVFSITNHPFGGTPTSGNHHMFPSILRFPSGHFFSIWPDAHGKDTVATRQVAVSP